MGRGLGWGTHRGPCQPLSCWDSGILGFWDVCCITPRSPAAHGDAVPGPARAVPWGASARRRWGFIPRSESGCEGRAGAWERQASPRQRLPEIQRAHRTVLHRDGPFPGVGWVPVTGRTGIPPRVNATWVPPLYPGEKLPLAPLPHPLNKKGGLRKISS